MRVMLIPIWVMETPSKNSGRSFSDLGKLMENLLSLRIQSHIQIVICLAISFTNNFLATDYTHKKSNFLAVLLASMKLLKSSTANN